MTESKAKKPIHKYLDHWSEPEAAIASRYIEACIDFPYAMVLAVPITYEHRQLPRCLEAIANAARTSGERPLLIAIVNIRTSATPEVVSSSVACLNILREDHVALFPPTGALQLVRHRDLDILIVDRTAEERRFPSDQGVGLARKIGNDVALRLITDGFVQNPVIGNTDADASVPADYFLRLSALPQETAGVHLFPFVHVRSDASSDVAEATLLYERHLHYYVEGLSFAGSPYAYMSLGSVISIHAHTYAAIRGHPKLLAAEDFYLLSKAAKIASIKQLTGDPIELAARDSTRVPFGTGQATRKILSLAGEEYKTYDPRSFLALKAALRAADAVLASDNDYARQLATELDSFGDLVKDRITVLTALTEDTSRANLRHLIAKARSAGKHRAKRMFDDTFDALKTLQFIHALRDSLWPDQPLVSAIETFSSYRYNTNGLNDSAQS